MRRATRVSIEKAMQPYLYTGRYGHIILQNDLDEIMKMIMTEFSGVYCGAFKNKAGALVFSVTSTGTRRTKFFEAIVR
jgi:hypothetical protein